MFDVAAGLLVPPGQIAAVGMARKAVENIDGRIQVIPLVEDLDTLDPLGQVPAQVPSAW